MADGGSWLPITWEKFTPAFSKVSPPSITMEMPPPPSSLDQESGLNLSELSSRASSSEQILDCNERINEITDSNDSRFTKTILRGKLSRSRYFMENVERAGKTKFRDPKLGSD